MPKVRTHLIMLLMINIEVTLPAQWRARGGGTHYGYIIWQFYVSISSFLHWIKPFPPQSSNSWKYINCLHVGNVLNRI